MATRGIFACGLLVADCSLTPGASVLLGVTRFASVVVFGTSLAATARDSGHNKECPPIHHSIT